MTKDITSVTYNDYLEKFYTHLANTLGARGYTLIPTSHKEYVLVTKTINDMLFQRLISAHPAGYKQRCIRAVGGVNVIKVLKAKGITAPILEN